jgi:uncharacterized protein YaiE (UPF0345 family)
MNDFKNATLTAKANVYYDGKVNSRTFYNEEGERKTLGFMLAGSYTFGTHAEEIMEIIGGSMDVKLPGESEYKTYTEGTSFTVPSNSSFQIIIDKYADYCCSYYDK